MGGEYRGQNYVGSEIALSTSIIKALDLYKVMFWGFILF
jgi:hypothetical protein